MDTFYTIEEKYLQAVDEMTYGETPKALQLLNEIITNDPMYARAHFQLGKLYYYNIKDYNAAGYHFKTCTELEPLFPDVYVHYLNLIVFLNKANAMPHIVAKALTIPGVNAAAVYNLLGLFAEKNKNWAEALKAYRDAFIEVTCHKQQAEINESIARIKLKTQQGLSYQYHMAE